MNRHVDHIIRPYPPWSEPVLTNCGHRVEKVHSVISLDEAKRRVEELGKRRAVLTICMTCADRLHPLWDHNPLGVLAAAPRDTVVRDLRAIALLIEAHRDEFDATVAGLAQTTALTVAGPGGTRAT